MAQEKFYSVTAGLNMTNVIKNGDFFETTMPKPGANIGFHRNILCENNLNFNFGIAFTDKGFRNRFEYDINVDNSASQTGDALYAYRYRYIGTALNIGYTCNEKYKLTPFFGITQNFLIQAQTAYSLTENETRTKYKRNDYARLKHVDFSCQAGISAEYNVDANYTPFLAFIIRGSLNSFSDVTYFSNEKLRHYGISLMLGIKFNSSDKTKK